MSAVRNTETTEVAEAYAEVKEKSTLRPLRCILLCVPLRLLYSPKGKNPLESPTPQLRIHAPRRAKTEGMSAVRNTETAESAEVYTEVTEKFPPGSLCCILLCVPLRLLRFLER